MGLALLMGDQLRSVDVPAFLASQLMLLLVNFVVINLWEEVAWTGLFQTRLEERHNWLIAAFLTAIPFAAIHLPLQFFLGQPVTLASLAAAFGLYLLLGLLVRPMLAVFRRGTGDSISWSGCCTASSTEPTTKMASRPHCSRGRTSARDVDRRCPAHRCDRGRGSFPTGPSVWGRTRRAVTNRGGQPSGLNTSWNC